MIHFITPYRIDKNLGKAYNDAMAMLPNNNDWACFTDGDAMFTVADFGTQLEEVIKANPECKLFTSMTNRIGTAYQCVADMWEENNMVVHFQKGKELSITKRTSCIDITAKTPLSGVLILIQKKEWKRSGGFEESGKALGVDNSIHYNVRDAQGKIFLMEGVYMMHYYRNGNRGDKSHLQ